MNALPTSSFELVKFLVHALGRVSWGQIQAWLIHNKGADINAHTESQVCMEKGEREGIFYIYEDDAILWIEWK